MVLFPSTPYNYGYSQAISDSKTGYNAVDQCDLYQNQTEFNSCANGYFHGYVQTCRGTKYGCETHPLPELQQNGLNVIR
jgi:hypothetical protein